MSHLNASYTRELHIDAQEITEDHKTRLLMLGFADDYFTAAGGGLERPAHHFTWETQGENVATRVKRQSVFTATIIMLSQDPGFRGYIESEIIVPNCQAAFIPRPFSAVARIPLEPLVLIKTSQNKVADLHIKVPLDFLNEHMEAEFKRIGCYFVETPKRNRIYTIQFLSHRLGKRLFTALRNCFESTGGVTELTYEVCDAFVRIPADLEAPAVLQDCPAFGEFRNLNNQESSA